MFLPILAMLLATVPLEEMVVRLDDTAWTLRRDTTRDLAANWETYPLEQIEAQLRRVDLALEQRQRLIHAVDVRLLTLPRGALGIQMQDFGRAGVVAPDGPESGTMIIRLIRGMPAERQLREGDVITSIEEEPVRDRADLVRLVQRRWPGEEISIVLQRPPEGEGEWTTHLVELELGSVADLPGRVAASDRQDDVRYIAGLRRLYGIQPMRLPGPAGADASGTEFDWMLDAIRSQRRALDEGTAGAPRAIIEQMWGDWLEVTEAALQAEDLPDDDRRRLESLIEILRLETNREPSGGQGDVQGGPDEPENDEADRDPQRH